MYESRRMAPRFLALPLEVVFELEKLTGGAGMLYISLLAHCVIEENWNIDGEWVQGTVTVNKTEIVRRIGKSRSVLYTEGVGWKALVGSGLVMESSAGLITFPKYKKKSDDFISLAEMRDHGLRLDRLEGIMYDGNGEASELFAAGLSHKARAISDQNRAISDHIRADIARGDTSTSLSPPREIEEEEENMRAGAHGSKELAVVDNSVDNSELIRVLIKNLWPSRGAREEDEAFVAKYAGDDPERLSEAFAAAKSQRARRLNWLENRLDDPDVYKGAANGQREGKRQRADGDFQSGKHDQGSHAGSARGNKKGVGRVDIEEWPEA